MIDGSPKVLLPGSGELNRELVIALRRLGAEVSAGSADAPARPDVVVTTADAVSPDEPAEGSPELVPTARAARLTADREGLRLLAADQLGLPTAPFWFAGSVGELDAVGRHAGFPLRLKPVTGGRGGALVARPEDVEAAYLRAGSERVLAESVVEKEFDVTLLTVSGDGPRGPVIDFCRPIGHRRAEGGALECWQPQPMHPAALDAARSIAARIVRALGGRGVFGIELMVNGEEVYFVDVTAFPGQSALVTLRSQRLSVFDLQARNALGMPVDTMMISPGAARAMPPGGHWSSGVLGGALGVPESDFRVLGGSAAVALATAPDLATARDRVRQVAAALNTRGLPSPSR